MGAKIDMQRGLETSTSFPNGRRVSAALYDPRDLRELLDSVKQSR